MQTKTIVCKLNVAPDVVPRIDKTLVAFADACNFVADLGRKEKRWRQFELHRLCYKEIRARFGLSANLAVRAIARVSPRLRKEKTRNSIFRPTSIDYDNRIFRFHEKDWLVGLTLLDGRAKFALSIGQYQRDNLVGQTPTAATLVKRNGIYFLNICVKVPDKPVLHPTSIIGVDMGITDIAVLSDGTRFSGKDITIQRLQRAKVRRSLQTKAAKKDRTGRRSCHRLNGRLKGREARYQKVVNHKISRLVVEKAKAENAGIAIEDLTGIRDRTQKKLRRKQRGLHSSWAFYQLRSFLEYKAKREGVPLVIVDPHYTSQTCAQCQSKGTRRGKVFACPKCGTFDDADKNAAKNIARLGRLVIPPAQSSCCVVERQA